MENGHYICPHWEMMTGTFGLLSLLTGTAWGRKGGRKGEKKSEDKQQICQTEEKDKKRTYDAAEWKETVLNGEKQHHEKGGLE